MSTMRRIVSTIFAVFLAFALAVGLASTAAAAQDHSRNTKATKVVPRSCGTGPVTGSGTPEDPFVSCIDYGESHFDAVDDVKVKTKLKLKGGKHVYLNVKAKPIRDNGHCRTAPVGTPFDNEVIDPATGQHMFDPTTVQAGDNVFCFVGGKWVKKSCGNEAKGLFGTPRAPARLRIHGKVKTVDYLTWKAQQFLDVSKSGSAFVSVHTETCAAGSTVDNTVVFRQKFVVKFRSRTLIDAEVKGGREIEIKAHNDQTVEGWLRTHIVINLHGSATAWCSTPPPPPPPPGNPKPLLLDYTVPNDLEVNWSMQVCATFSLADGRTGTLTITAVFGTITGGSPFTVSGQGTVCATLTAPSEVPTGSTSENLPPGKDKVKYYLVDNASGDDVLKEAVYGVNPTAPPPPRQG